MHDICSPILDPGEAVHTLIDRLLADQQTLAPVLRFAQVHQAGSTNARYYRDLIPLSRPKPGQQYAFEVDLDQCSGCKACVTACHNLNGLDEEETWRSVGVLYGETNGGPFQQAVTTSCHHCVDPGCLTGCPVKAYDKDPLTGIVRHLDDQCIGCQYCILMCPYDVPKYNRARGIVRKCDMCSSRLATGEAPACVQGCPNEAIRITLVDSQELLDRFRGDKSTNNFLPTAPDPQSTVPTTRYVNSRPIPRGTKPAGAEILQPAPSHLPLVFMLVLTQLAVGGFIWLAVLGCTKFEIVERESLLATTSVVALFAGLLTSIFHLGRPHLAWRALLNVRTSWMSREIALFVALTTAAVLDIGARAAHSAFQSTATWLCAITGLAAVFSSVMIYQDTHRAFWNFKSGSIRFLGSTLLLGSFLTMLLCPGQEIAQFAAVLVVVTTALKLDFELAIVRTSSADESLKRSAALMRGPLQRFTVARFIFGALGGLICPIFFLNAAAPHSLSILASGAFLFSFFGEILERFLFFTAVSPDRMPQPIVS